MGTRRETWYVIAKLPGMTRFESLRAARAHGNREFGSRSSACELAREFRRRGFPAKVKKGLATI